MAIASPARSRRAVGVARPTPGAATPVARRGTTRPDSSRRAERPVAHRGARVTHVPAVVVVVCLSLVVGSLLVSVAAHAYLTQGQIRLASLQQKVTAQVNEHRDLELQVAQLEDPSHVVLQAERLGLVAPGQVGDLTQVPLDEPLAVATGRTAPTRSTSVPSTTVAATARTRLSSTTP
jgi:cell division protein FtsL